jgi:hypothetical protein
MCRFRTIRAFALWKSKVAHYPRSARYAAPPVEGIGFIEPLCFSERHIVRKKSEERGSLVLGRGTSVDEPFRVSYLKSSPAGVRLDGRVERSINLVSSASSTVCTLRVTAGCYRLRISPARLNVPCSERLTDGRGIAFLQALTRVLAGRTSKYSYIGLLLRASLYSLTRF